MNDRIKLIITSLLAGVALTLAFSSMAGMTEAKSVNPNLGATPMTDTETFKAFGGKEGLVKIMDDFMDGLVTDPRTADFLGPADKTRIKAMLVEQMCEILNGGCTYPGRSMLDSHKNMKVNRAAFNGLVEQFQIAMDKHNVPFSAQNKLLAKLAPMYRAIERTTGDAVAPENKM